MPRTKTIGRASSSIKTFLKRAGLTRSMSAAANLRWSVDANKRDKMAAAYKNGASLSESAELIGVAPSTAHSELRRRKLLRTKRG